MLANFSSESLTIPKATLLGVAEGVSKALIDDTNPGKESAQTSPVRPPRKREKERKAGSKRSDVDALSRHVGAVTQENPLNRENVRREQAKDAFCSKQTPGAYRSKQEYFLDTDGVMYKRRSNGNHQLVVPKSLVSAVIKGNHDPVYIAHPGVKRTLILSLYIIGGQE
jgi:hypothetical protein